MRLSELPRPSMFAPIRVEPGWRKGECGVSRGHRAQRVQSMRPRRASEAHPESTLRTVAVHSASRDLAREEAEGRGDQTSASGQFAREEHDHGLSNVHNGLARPMMVWSDMGPK